MNPDSSPQSAGAHSVPFQILIWWIIWFGVFSGLGIVYFVFGQRELIPMDASSPIGLVALGPLVMSALVRWLLLPRIRDIKMALPVFVIGLGLAEGAGVLAVLLGGAYRNELVLLSALAVLQFIPIFAVKQFSTPPPTGHGLRGAG
jgi:hypothetical protein